MRLMAQKCSENLYSTNPFISWWVVFSVLCCLFFTKVKITSRMEPKIWSWGGDGFLFLVGLQSPDIHLAVQSECCSLVSHDLNSHGIVPKHIGCKIH